ncbi:MAG TPA: cation:proton antiporter [Gemmatimonadales bacterium]|nr:cation:proton antiporter [Gemmatimonadales bacterium]
MHDLHEFLRSLTIVLAVAAITTVLFQRLRQPVVLGYIIAGLIVGPHVPIPIVADPATVRTLSELGVILLMFSLGLEFHLAKLIRVGPTAGFTAFVQSSLAAWLGFLAGQLFGWTVLESVFAGAIVAISSTTIIAKVFDEERVGGRLRELVVGVLLVEDLMAVVFMAVLTAVATGAGLSTRELAGTVGRLVLFLVALLVAGILIVPRFIRFVMRIGRAETTLVASIGICFVTAYVALAAGYSVALGAFLAGSLVAESGNNEAIERLVQPVRDMFAAIFFVSVGMLIEPRLVAEHWRAVVAFTAIVLIGKSLGVTVGAFFAGAGTRTALQAGMSLSQIGEFSFIIASLGVALGATGDFLYPVTVAVSAITTLTTPWLIRASGPVAAYVDRKLPRPLQTFAALYGSWLDRLKAASTAPRADGGMGRNIRRLIRLLLLDVLVLSGLIIVVAMQFDALAVALVSSVGASGSIARALILLATVAAALPLVLGIGRIARSLGGTLSEAALPPASGKADLDAAPRRTLGITLQLGVALAAGIVVVTLTQLFLPSYSGPLALFLVVAGFGVAIWRSVRDLEGHVRAGAQAVVAALGRYARKGSETDDTALADVNQLLPGLGAPVALRIEERSPAVGRSLAELNLRGRSGATILAISRNNESIVVPQADERLEAGDVVALAGSRDAIDSAKELLR